MDKSLRPGFERPVVLHRVILGSLERFLAIVCEQYGGRFPFWLSPRQLMICNVDEKSKSFAARIADQMMLAGYQCSLDSSSQLIQKKIRNASLKHFCYIAVVGQEEVESECVDLRDAYENSRMVSATHATHSYSATPQTSAALGCLHIEAGLPLSTAHAKQIRPKRRCSTYSSALIDCDTIT